MGAKTPPVVLHLGAAVLALLLVVGLTVLTDPFTNLRIATVGYYLLALAGLAVLTGMGGQVSLAMRYTRKAPTSPAKNIVSAPRKISIPNRALLSGVLR